MYILSKTEVKFENIPTLLLIWYQNGDIVDVG